MEMIYFALVAFLICLAVFDLFVGVSNDAVNFMQSAIGARVASYKKVLIVASAGVMVGAVLSQGMMDVARHGVLVPAEYSLSDVMVVFMGVMVANVLVLHAFNAMGMPTSTTVSLVFALLGGAVAVALIKMASDPSLSLSELINTDKAFQVIIAIFVSVAIAFLAGMMVQWVARIVFTFSYQQHQRYTIGLFGGIGITTLAYFIFLQGLGKSPMVPEDIKVWINANTPMLLLAILAAGTVVSQLLHWAGVNIFKMVVLMGTFALAMAFAGNDLVNFIGVPLAGLDSVMDYHLNGSGALPSSYKMSVLMKSATTPPAYLAVAGVVMVVAMATSKKAKKVIQTGIDLSRQDEGDEMFGSSLAARSIVRGCQDLLEKVQQVVAGNAWLRRLDRWIDTRFAPVDTPAGDNGAAFDVVRAAINLVLAAMLITVGTNLKLPLSTTYVTFMVAMGSSLADHAWKRESAVFRVTGVISVIGGWFVTAGASLVVCGIVAVMMYYGGLLVQMAFVGLVIFMLVRPAKKSGETDANADEAYRLMMRTKDPGIVWELLRRHTIRTQSAVNRFATAQYEQMVEGFLNHKSSRLRGINSSLREEQLIIKKLRRQELLGLRRCPTDIAVERNTWFHVGINASRQYLYCLTRMLEPIKEHVDNNFTPLAPALVEEYTGVSRQVVQLMRETETCISTTHFGDYRRVLADADQLKDHLSLLRKQQIDRIQQAEGTDELQVSLVYLSLLQETQQLLSNMRHQLRGAKKFLE